MAIITLGGNIGSGKTHISKKLAEYLKYEEFNVSQLFRSLAAKEGLTIDEFYPKLKHDPRLERSIDDLQAKLFREKDNLVAQGRIAWHFAAQSPFRAVNVFLAVNPEIGAERISDRPEYIGKNNAEIVRLIAARETEERMRYKNLYGIEDHLDPKHYNLLVDTTHLTPDEVTAAILEHSQPLVRAH